MELLPLKSRRLKPGVDLPQALRDALKQARLSLKSGDILVVASKVVSFSEKRMEEAAGLNALVERDAEKVFGKGDMRLTVTRGIVIPNAGIDFSNAPKGKIMLWPKDPFTSARKLRKIFDLPQLGVVISDSTIRPLRVGVTGIAIGWAGFEGVRDDRKVKDLFGSKLRYTQVAVADLLASCAELLMKKNEAVPFVLIRGAEVEFTHRQFGPADYAIDPKECLYRSFFLS